MATDTSNKLASRKWYRLFQFRLRTLLFAVAIVGCGLGFFGLKLRKAQRQKEIVALLKADLISVYYDYEFSPDGNWVDVSDPVPPGPEWMRSLLGVDFFSRVRYLHICGNGEVTPGSLEGIRDLPDLKSLYIDFDEPAEVWKSIGEYTQLQELYILCDLTDVDIDHINGLCQLRKLKLRAPHVTDDGLRCLERLTNLEELSLEATPVTDAGLVHLNNLVRLTKLDLWNTRVSAAGVAALQRSLPKCEILSPWSGKSGPDRDFPWGE